MPEGWLIEVSNERNCRGLQANGPEEVSTPSRPSLQYMARHGNFPTGGGKPLENTLFQSLEMAVDILRIHPKKRVSSYNDSLENPRPSGEDEPTNQGPFRPS